MIKKGVDQEKRRALAFCVGFLFEPPGSFVALRVPNGRWMVSWRTVHVTQWT
jgi:hypothetical protein